MEGFPNSHTEVHMSEANFRLFHTIDRILYVILVTNLLCDPMEAMQIMAIWLWLERVGFLNTITKILHLPITLINELVDEANTCLCFINNPCLFLENEANDIHLTQSLIKDFSLQYLQKNQTLAKIGVDTVQTKICMQAFGDLMQQAIMQNEARRVAQSPQPLYVQQKILPNDLGNGVVPDEERTVFVTFSKGYPVEEWEIRDFLVKNFGDCIESFYMEKVKEIGDQPLYARIVLFQANIIHIILNDLPKAKLTINGKHVWMRKYVPRIQRSINATTPQLTRC
ncbi:RNA-binding protein Musashi Rbp6 like [Heracleum sosnowskyi]|uniref:RNA-binding protein Musashi Rbp6 like n=1 Tax=Heracleum sosnowskyi TaxID=360622 RepID=A0AAD8I5I5_9APIA|nr:RNA-binding protein Musashi Rbp6 like [Heracleum sosnowskyi]